MNKITLGLLAHVDAGKTTLAEDILYKCGKIRKIGRVDHQTSYFDSNEQERKRGITIFSKQAEINLYDKLDITLMDTPGHVDFVAETERILQVLDYAVVIVSAREGIQSHTKTLFKLLEKYQIPYFIFINKMDISLKNKDELLLEINESINGQGIDFINLGLDKTLENNKFTDKQQACEELAVCSEKLLEEFLENGNICIKSIKKEIANRKIIPLYFGSALQMEAIDNLLEGISIFAQEKEKSEEFSAKVYKIGKGKQGEKLTFIKIIGGSLKVKQIIKIQGIEEKIEQIRIYDNESFKNVQEVKSGDVCAVIGLKETYTGQNLGNKGNDTIPILEPAMSYGVKILNGDTPSSLYLKLKEINEEYPELKIVWDEETSEIKMQFMGEIQSEVITQIVKDRFDVDIAFDTGKVRYKETISETSYGIGHFEPLRHYAEVHLKIEPIKRGSGIKYEIDVSEDELNKNWQNLILTHLKERTQRGIMTNSPLTDVKISIVGGKSHIKHTEGGDFREATYRSLRNALIKNKGKLLEPYYNFEIEVPEEYIGRVMNDIQEMSGEFSQPEFKGEKAILNGKAPAVNISGYNKQIAALSKGEGSIVFTDIMYDECHNQETVMLENTYNWEEDYKNTGDSIFCTHGEAFIVPWNEVENYAHIQIKNKKQKENDSYIGIKKDRANVSDNELKQIFEKTYGKPKDRTQIHKRTIYSRNEKIKIMEAKIKEEYVLVDGYNIIFAWEELKELAKANFDSARQALLDILSNYQGFKGCKMIVVFDAYKVKGRDRVYEKFNDIDIVYTKEAETADCYIEKFTYENRGEYYIRVATSDSLEQLIILGNGAFKVSADDFKVEVENMQKSILEVLKKYNKKAAEGKVTIGDVMKKE